MANSTEKTALMKQIEREIKDYTTKVISLGDNITYSQHKLVRRIVLFESKTYPTGKFDSQGNYKYWFDMITPRVDDEVKNIDFDTKNIEGFTPRPIDETINIIVNLRLRDWLRENGQAEELNNAIEEGSGWGNVVWKKIKGSYERVDLRNFYVINQTARSLRNTPVIEYHELSQTELRDKSGKWENVDKVISNCGTNSYKRDDSATEEETTTPYYSIFERNGEVNLYDLKKTRLTLGLETEAPTEKDKEKYVYAKVIAAGTQNSNGAVKIKYITFADQLSKAAFPYKEYHRGRYKGRWWREGLYELLFDIQVRGNEIGNQIAKGLEWSSKKVFYSPDKLVIQNVMTDLKNGDLLRTKDLKSVDVRMEGFDQLVNEWNRLVQMADDIANSLEIVQGEAQPGQPFRLGALLNINANKLFDFIREKLAIPLGEIFEQWIIPQLIDELKKENIVKLTGDSDMMNRLHELVVEAWYVRNLTSFAPHGPDVQAFIKTQQLEKIKKNKNLFVKEFHAMLEDYKPRAAVVITGENIDIQEKLQTLGTFISMESDPVRRSYLIEKAMRLKGIDVGALPRSTPEQLQGVRPPTSREGASEESRLLTESTS